MLPNTATALCLVSPFGTAFTRTCDKDQKEQGITKQQLPNKYLKHINVPFSALSKAVAWILLQSYTETFRFDFVVILLPEGDSGDWKKRYLLYVSSELLFKQTNKQTKLQTEVLHPYPKLYHPC